MHGVWMNLCPNDEPTSSVAKRAEFGREQGEKDPLVVTSCLVTKNNTLIRHRQLVSFIHMYTHASFSYSSV